MKNKKLAYLIMTIVDILLVIGLLAISFLISTDHFPISQKILFYPMCLLLILKKVFSAMDNFANYKRLLN